MFLAQALKFSAESNTDTINSDMEISLNFFEAYADTSEAIATCEEAFGKLDELNAAYTEVTSLEAHIKEHGITKQLAMFVDSENEVISSETMDELTDIPSDNEAALEGIKEVAKKVWKAIKNFFKKIWDFIKRMFGSAVSFFKSAEANLEKAYNDIKDKADSAFDSKKLKDTKLKVWKNKECFKAAKEGVSTLYEKTGASKIKDKLENVVSELEKTDPDVKKIADSIQGLATLQDSFYKKFLFKASVTTKKDTDGNVVSVDVKVEENPWKETEEKTVADIGIKDIKDICSKTLASIKDLKKQTKDSEKDVVALEKKTTKAIDAWAKEAEKAADGDDDKRKELAKLRQKFTSVVQRLVSQFMKVNTNYLAIAKSVTKTATSMALSAKRCLE